MALATPAPQLAPLVERVHASLLGRPPAPEPEVLFYPYAQGKSTVRERAGRLEFRLNDSLAGAPDEVLEGLVGILLCRIRRVPEGRVPAQAARAYRQYLNDRPAPARPRSRKHIEPVGRHRSLLESYLRVSLDMGLQVPQVPTLSWSKTVSRHRFGHWDPEHKAVVISQVLDDPRVPEAVLDYVLYHELLHIVHPVVMGQGSKRRIHTAAFRRDERKFPEWQECERWMAKLARRR